MPSGCKIEKTGTHRVVITILLSEVGVLRNDCTSLPYSPGGGQRDTGR